MVLVDNLALAFSVGKRRSANHAMLRVNQKVGAIMIASNITLRVRWVPSELNVADGPSRGESSPGYTVPDRHKEAKGDSSIIAGTQGDPMPDWTIPMPTTGDIAVKNIGAQKVVKKRVVSERRSVTCSFTVDEVPAGKKAQKGQLTHLERKSISCEQENQYQHYFRRFKDFCKANGLRWPPQKDVDLLLADFFDVLFQEGHGVRVGEKTLAAVEYHWHKVKGTLLRSRRALRGWRKQVPPKSRLPLPRTVAFGIAMRLLSLQQKSMALMVLLSFDAYLRPGEAHALKVKNLVTWFPRFGEVDSSTRSTWW